MFDDPRYELSGTITTDGKLGDFTDLNFIKDWSIAMTTPGEGDGVSTEVLTPQSGAPFRVTLSRGGGMNVTEDSISILHAGLQPLSRFAIALGTSPQTAEIHWTSAGAGLAFPGGPATELEAVVTIHDADDPSAYRQNFLGRFSEFVFARNGVAVAEPSAASLFCVAAAVLACRRVRPVWRRLHPFAVGSVVLVICATNARSDVYQWEYVDPANPGLGKLPSSLLCAGGEGAIAEPGASWTGLDLSMAYLHGANLEGVTLSYWEFVGYPWEPFPPFPAVRIRTILTFADLSESNLENANLAGAEFADADLSSAHIRGANFGRPHSLLGGLAGTGMTADQLYSTASYQARDLAGVGFDGNSLAGVDFSDQNLAQSSFSEANLADADFRNSRLRGADFSFAALDRADFAGADARGGVFSRSSVLGSGLTLTQLYSTESYVAGDLSEIDLTGNRLSGGNFVGHRLVNARFASASIDNADFSGAEVRGADFSDSGLTLAQLYSTASYQQRDLRGLSLRFEDLRDADFSDHDLRGAEFGATSLAGANLAGAQISDANFDGAGLTVAQLHSTKSHQTRDLHGVSLAGNEMSAANFSGQNLAQASFAACTLLDAVFADAVVDGANFFRTTSGGFTASQLYSTATYKSGDLSSMSFAHNDLSGWSFAGTNLASADLSEAVLTNADFTDADVNSASFAKGVGTGISTSQLYSTASYRTQNLRGVNFSGNDLGGTDFTGQCLIGANFYGASLAGADFTAADVRGAAGINKDLVVSTNMIWSDGFLRDLHLRNGEQLLVRNDDRSFLSQPSVFPFSPPIYISAVVGFDVDARGSLVLKLDENPWRSTISFESGIPVNLAGTLQLGFADSVSLPTQVGRTFQLFDWRGVTPTGAFTISTPYDWELANLYTTGEITLVAVPEPGSVVLLVAAVSLLILRARRTRVVLAVAVASATAPPALADLPMTGAYVPELQAADSLLQNFMVGKPIPGGTIAITHDDKVVYERGIGYSNEARTVPMQETALMRLASVSKPITASAIQQLANDGQLSLDDKVFNIGGNGGILNITPYNGTLGDSRLRDITLQHLLEHKGGWNREAAGDLAFEDISIATTMGVPSPPGIANTARYILSQPLQVTPGSAEYYSNIGYMFLGMVVEAASGQTYENYVDNHVLAPAGIPTWEVDAGRTFAVDQNPREPVYSDPTLFPNVFNPGGLSVPVPYGGWDNEKALAFGGLIASSKAIAVLAQSRVGSGPEIGKLRSDSTANSEYGGHLGVLPGTLTLMVQANSQDWTYSILFDGLPADWSTSSISLFDSLNQILGGVATWPEALIYAGDFTSDQWLTLDDIMLFNQALALGSETAFSTAYPMARYSAGDFDGNGLVNTADASGLIGALQHAGVPPEYVALVQNLPGDFNNDGIVDAADLAQWQDDFGLNAGSDADHDADSDGADFLIWQQQLAPFPPVGVAAPEPSSVLLIVFGFALVGRRRLQRRANESTVRDVDAASHNASTAIGGGATPRFLCQMSHRRREITFLEDRFPG
jgi:uncharacterized protein YjbI with pentapeptide repeats/CubicO group peptidase (beta-lactamase class C family)